MTKKEQCKVDLLSMWGSKHPIEKMRKEYHEYCPKSKSNNIVFCPEKIIKRKKDIRVQWINDYFKNFGKKIKNKPGKENVKKTDLLRKRGKNKKYGKTSILKRVPRPIHLRNNSAGRVGEVKDTTWKK